MIKIKDVSIKNFLSIGNVSQAVKLDKGDLTLVLGENLDQGGQSSENRNGAGKTSMLNAISYAIYGQALSNIKKGNLINKVNGKHMLVTLTFSKDNVEYRIERGRSPSVLKFYVDDQEQVPQDESQGDSRETQKAITDLIGMSHDMFKHIVALNTYNEPFLSMKASDQREIIEQLLGITILTEKAEALREMMKQTKNSINSEIIRISSVEESNKKITQSINSLKTRQKAWKTKQASDVEKLKNSLKNFNELDIDQEMKNHEILENWNKNNSLFDNLTKDLNSYELASDKNKKDMEKINNEIQDLENSVCYACGQAMHENKLEQIKSKKNADLQELEKFAIDLQQKITDCEKQISEIPQLPSAPVTFYESLQEVYEHRNNVNTISERIEQISSQEDPYCDQISDLETTALQEINWENLNGLKKLLEHQEFLLKLLTNKDSFIRKKIIDQNLSYLNSRLNYYLEDLGLPHNVKFLNDLSVEITQLGQDLDFDNLSRGERNRLILSLSFAFRDVWENLYHGINLMFIDELIDSGMDGSGVDNALYVLKKMARENNKNVFLISHRDELQGRVNSILRVIKENGFTSFDTDLAVSDEY